MYFIEVSSLRHRSGAATWDVGAAHHCRTSAGEFFRSGPAPWPVRGGIVGIPMGYAMSARAATVGPVRVATWNVNSVKQRVPRLLPWLDQRQPDIVCLQETKLEDGDFEDLLGADLRSKGYELAVHGEARWNGVAILSRVGLDDVVAGIDGAPGFPEPEARAIAGTCGGIRVRSVYVPNGRVPDSDHYHYKLAWLAALREAVSGDPDAAIVCGDMNI